MNEFLAKIDLPIIISLAVLIVGDGGIVGIIKWMTPSASLESIKKSWLIWSFQAKLTVRLYLRSRITALTVVTQTILPFPPA